MKKKNLRQKSSKEGGIEVYKNPKISVKKRVKDLLSRMALAEKAVQMMCVWQEKNTKLLDADGNFD